MKNRVLSPEEVSVLEVGKSVWIDHKPDAWSVRVKNGPAMVREREFHGKVLEQNKHDFYATDANNSYLGTMYRVWLHEPSAAELAANPWP